jgi:hypothetical protein
MKNNMEHRPYKHGKRGEFSDKSEHKELTAEEKDEQEIQAAKELGKQIVKYKIAEEETTLGRKLTEDEKSALKKKMANDILKQLPPWMRSFFEDKEI